jgi:hypothetical protein
VELLGTGEEQANDVRQRQQLAIDHRLVGNDSADGGNNIGGDSENEFPFALEIEIDRTCRETSFALDVLHRSLVEAVAQEADTGGIEDLLSASR